MYVRDRPLPKWRLQHHRIKTRHIFISQTSITFCLRQRKEIYVTPAPHTSHFTNEAHASTRLPGRSTPLYTHPPNNNYRVSRTCAVSPPTTATARSTSAVPSVLPVYATQYDAPMAPICAKPLLTECPVHLTSVGYNSGLKSGRRGQETKPGAPQQQGTEPVSEARELKRIAHTVSGFITLGLVQRQ